MEIAACQAAKYGWTPQFTRHVPGPMCVGEMIRWPAACPCPRRSTPEVGRKKQKRTVGPDHLRSEVLAAPTSATGWTGRCH